MTQFKIIIFILFLTAFYSCESQNSTDYKDKPVLFCFAKALSTIDSLYFSSTGGINEAINYENLGISGAEITLYEKSPEQEEYSFVGILNEYSGRKGLYYLPSAVFPIGFKAGHSYRITANHADLGELSAETVCPPPLDSIVAKNMGSGKILASIAEDPSAVDTLYYKRGRSYDDIKFYGCSFDSLPVILDKRMASYRIIPDELNRYDETFWLEDTTSAVWDNYPVETRIWKNKDKYGKDFMEYFIRSMSVHWYALYHGGMNTLVLSSTDQAFRSYMETLYDPDRRYTNVKGGYGLFSLSNSSSEKSVYRVFIVPAENK
jgi:hypothetical protein